MPAVEVTEQWVRELLGQRIKGERLYLLARRMGVSSSFLCHVAHGRRSPSDAVLRALGVRREVRYVVDQDDSCVGPGQ